MKREKIKAKENSHYRHIANTLKSGIGLMEEREKIVSSEKPHDPSIPELQQKIKERKVALKDYENMLESNPDYLKKEYLTEEGFFPDLYHGEFLKNTIKYVSEVKRRLKEDKE